MARGCAEGGIPPVDVFPGDARPAPRSRVDRVSSCSRGCSDPRAPVTNLVGRRPMKGEEGDDRERFARGRSGVTESHRAAADRSRSVKAFSVAQDGRADGFSETSSSRLFAAAKVVSSARPLAGALARAWKNTRRWKKSVCAVACVKKYRPRHLDRAATGSRTANKGRGIQRPRRTHIVQVAFVAPFAPFSKPCRRNGGERRVAARKFLLIASEKKRARVRCRLNLHRTRHRIEPIDDRWIKVRIVDHVLSRSPSARATRPGT